MFVFCAVRTEGLYVTLRVDAAEYKEVAADGCHWQCSIQVPQINPFRNISGNKPKKPLSDGHTSGHRKGHERAPRSDLFVSNSDINGVTCL